MSPSNDNLLNSVKLSHLGMIFYSIQWNWVTLECRSGCMDTIRSRRSRRNSLRMKFHWFLEAEQKPLQTGRVKLTFGGGAETFTDGQGASLLLALALLHLHHGPALPLVPLALGERTLLPPTKRNRIGTEPEQRVRNNCQGSEPYLYLFWIAFVELLSPRSLGIC